MAWLPIIWVEGLIAAGKTTLVRVLAELLGYRALYEPVTDEELLRLFYQDPKRWAFPFQIEMARRRSTLHELAMLESQVVGTPWKGTIIDRGLPGDRVFASLHYRSGNITDVEWRIYEELYRKWMFVPNIQPTMLLYLDVEPEVALCRIKERGREAEREVDIGYLRDVHDAYGRLMREMESGAHPWARGMRVLRVPWNKDNEPVEPIAETVRAVCSVPETHN